MTSVRDLLNGSSIVALACAGSVVFALSTVSSVASGADKQACVAAHEDAQLLRLRGQMLEARDHLVACAQDECPAPVRSDCAAWLREVENALPTVVIAARDTNRADIPDVQVTLDQTIVVPRLVGRPLAVNPGEHVFRFQHLPSPDIVRTIVVREGEKDRLLEVEFLAPRREGVPAAAKGRSSLPYVLWSLGGISLGTSLAMTLDARAERNGLSCSPHCSDEQVTPVRNELQRADVALGLGIVLLGVGTWLFFSSDTPAPPPPLPASTEFLRPVAARDPRLEVLRQQQPRQPECFQDAYPVQSAASSDHSDGEGPCE